MRNVDHDRRSHQLFDRNLLGRVSPLDEMHGRVEMRATVLGSREVIGRVVVATRCALRRDDGEPEGFRGRPVDGCGIEGIGEVDPFAVRQPVSDRAAGGAEQENEENALAHLECSG